MTTITIPKKIAQKGDLVIIPRKEYENLLTILRKTKKYRSQLDKDLDSAIQEAKKGKLFGPFKSVKALRDSLER